MFLSSLPLLWYTICMKNTTPVKSIVTRRASHDYALDDEIVVGIALTGPEVKSARMGHVQLKGSYVTIRQNELWLVNASFSIISNTRGEGRAVDTRDRKLLAHRRQIDKLATVKNDGQTIVPLKLLIGGRHIKLVIATGRGKKKYDKREDIKKRDTARENKKLSSPPM